MDRWQWFAIGAALVLIIALLAVALNEARYVIGNLLAHAMGHQ